MMVGIGPDYLDQFRFKCADPQAGIGRDGCVVSGDKAVVGAAQTAVAVALGILTERCVPHALKADSCTSVETVLTDARLAAEVA